MDPLIQLLADLVSANSINPSLVPGAPGEAAAAEVARDAMVRAGLDVVVTDVRPGRPNVVGVLDGREPGPTTMFCGHLDTVGVSGMIEPFVPRIDGDRLYGRGSQDMKGGVAAMIGAAAKVANSWTRGRLIVAAVMDEEYDSLGAEALVKDWTADYGIVTEPTDLALAIGHKGFAWLDVVTHGRAAHGSRPLEGRDAIMRMGRVLNRLERLDRELQSRPPSGVQGVASLHGSIITGGQELSSYPDLCTLRMERRTVTGEDDSRVLAEVEDILRELSRDDPEFSGDVRARSSRPPYAIDAAHRLPGTMAQVLGGRGLNATPGGMTFWTDAAILGSAGIPSVLFGPGGAGLHSTVEYVNISDVAACRDVLADTALLLAHQAA